MTDPVQVLKELFYWMVIMIWLERINLMLGKILTEIKRGKRGPKP